MCVYKSVFTRHCSIPSQIRDLTSDPSDSSASGQCKAAPVTQIGWKQLSKCWKALHECLCDGKISGGGLRWNKGKKKRGENDKGREERWGAWSGFRQDNGSPSDIWAFSLREGQSMDLWEEIQWRNLFFLPKNEADLRIKARLLTPLCHSFAPDIPAL